MSDVAKGASRVRRIEGVFHSFGYRTMLASRSGQRRGQRAVSLALDGDLIAIAPDDSGYPHFVIEVGGKSKSAKATFVEMRAQGNLPAGFRMLCCRLVDSKTRIKGKGWRFHLEDGGHDTLGNLLDAIKA